MTGLQGTTDNSHVDSTEETIADGSTMTASSADAWRTLGQQKTRKSRTWVRVLGYVGLGLFSFLFFLYLTFPYAVIKEGLVLMLSNELSVLNMRVNVGSLRPYWFTGVQMTDVTVSSTRDVKAKTRFREVRARLNVLPLLIGRVSVSAYLPQDAGSLEADVSLPISGLLRGAPIPSSAELNFKNFSMDSFVNIGLGLVQSASATGIGVALVPLLSTTTAGGNLNGVVTLTNPEAGSSEKLVGTANFTVRKMFLHIADQTFQIPRQEFSVAKLNVSYEKGAIVVKSADFEAQDIELRLDGKVVPPSAGGPLDLNLGMKLTMRRQFEQNIGNLLPAALHCMQPLKTKTLEDGRKESLLDAKLTGASYEAMQCAQN